MKDTHTKAGPNAAVSNREQCKKGALTFEKVLGVFEDYLRQDPVYEVVLTSHGYTLLAWNEARNEWYSAELMKSPKKLMDALLGAYAEFMEDKLTGSERDLTTEEQAEIDAGCESLRARCRSI